MLLSVISCKKTDKQIHHRNIFKCFYKIAWSVKYRLRFDQSFEKSLNWLNCRIHWFYSNLLKSVSKIVIFFLNWKWNCYLLLLFYLMCILNMQVLWNVSYWLLSAYKFDSFDIRIYFLLFYWFIASCSKSCRSIQSHILKIVVINKQKRFMLNLR